MPKPVKRPLPFEKAVSALTPRDVFRRELFGQRPSKSAQRAKNLTNLAEAGDAESIREEASKLGSQRLEDAIERIEDDKIAIEVMNFLLGIEPEEE